MDTPPAQTLHWSQKMWWSTASVSLLLVAGAFAYGFFAGRDVSFQLGNVQVTQSKAKRVMDDAKALLRSADKDLKEAVSQEDWEQVKHAINKLDQGLVAVEVLDKATMDVVKGLEKIKTRADYYSYGGSDAYSYAPSDTYHYGDYTAHDFYPSSAYSDAKPSSKNNTQPSTENGKPVQNTIPQPPQPSPPDSAAPSSPKQ